MAARLKVFVTSDGLTDYVVATSSRPKALAAWGAHQDLFATGGAYETDDPDLVEAATARPGEVLRRPRDVKTPRLHRPGRSRPAPARAPAPARPAKAKGPSPAAVKKAKDLEARLVAQAAAYAEAMDALADERGALEARRDQLERDYLAERTELREALRKARGALR